MAEDDISMNELEAAIQGLNATLKKFMEDEEIRHAEYMQSRSASISRMDRIEAKLVALQVDSASNGGSNSSAQSLSNEPFHMLTTMIDVNHDEIDASKDISALNLSISYTEQMAAIPYTTDELISSEAGFDAFPVVDASNLSGDQAFEQLIADYVEPNMLQGSVHSVVELDGCGKTKATFNVVDKQLHYSVVIDLRVSKLAIALTQPGISLSDPPDIVSVPPPLAPPWLHHSVYPQPWRSQYSFNFLGNNITNTTYGDSLYCVAIPQSNSQLLSFPTIVNFPSRYASNGSYPIFNCTVMVNHRLSSVPNSGWLLPEAKYNPLVSFHSQSSFHAILKNNLTSDARIVVSKCLLALVPCYTTVSIIGDGVIVGYGTRKSIETTNIKTLFAAHYVFDEMTLSGTCYFSNINWSLDFKQWDPGTINASMSGCPVINLRVILLEDNSEFDGNGEWPHELHGTSYNCLCDNCYECYALLSSYFNYKPPNIPSRSRCLTGLQYVGEELDYVVFNTGRCFDLYHIGSFQHLKGITSAMRLRYMKLLLLVVTSEFDSNVLVQNIFTYMVLLCGLVKMACKPLDIGDAPKMVVVVSLDFYFKHVRISAKSNNSVGAAKIHRSKPSYNPCKFTYFEFSFPNRSYCVIELLGSDFNRVSYTGQQYTETQIVVGGMDQGLIHWQTLMHLSLAKHSLPNGIIALPVLLSSQGFRKSSQKNNIVGFLYGKWILSIVHVKVSVVESCSLLILTVKEDNAFICELPVFQQVKFKQWDPGGECSLVYVEGPLDYENNVESCCYQFTPLLYFTPTLRTRLILMGGVML